ncbi:alpha/beta hydrolase [Marivirga sp.]|uniref:alpha/beta hydrolase n=1 Tax=Marivirga sp. TaxID=2018662 RepID=UPI003DA75267
MKDKLDYILIIAITLSLSVNSYAQRYESQIFDKVNMKTVAYIDTDEKSLEMDIYTAEKDSLEKRPVVLFVHGGGFAGGARNELEIMEFCRNMARRGIVAVSMSYTLVMKGQSFSCDQAAKNKMNTFKQVGLEISHATNYLLAHEEELKINPNKMILAGSSAGAEAVLHAAFWPEANSPLPDDFQYGGLISMAGAIYNLELINKETAIPMQFFHGTCDNLVPYGSAPHHYCEEKDTGYLMLHGPGAIREKLHAINEGYYIITGCNDNHSWAGKPFKYFRAEIADFIYHDVVLEKFRQHHQIISVFDNCKYVDAPVVCED